MNPSIGVSSARMKTIADDKESAHKRIVALCAFGIVSGAEGLGKSTGLLFAGVGSAGWTVSNRG